MKIVVPLVVLALAGCATWFPAHVEEISDGRYEISASGNSFASRDKMKKKLADKAESLCEARGYDHVNPDRIEWHEQKDYSTGTTTNYQTMTISIACRN